MKKIVWRTVLHVERRENGVWVPVIPPPPATSRSKPKWGTYEAPTSMEELALVGSPAGTVPTKPAPWVLGDHPVALQQLGWFWSNVSEEEEGEPYRNIEPFIHPCGLPSDASRTVRAVYEDPDYSTIRTTPHWYTLEELSEAIFTRRVGPEYADKRIVALRDALAEVAKQAGVTKKDLRTILWFERDRRPGDGM